MTHEQKQEFFKQEVAKLDEMIAEIDASLVETEKAKQNLVVMRETFDSQIDKEQLELELVD